MSAADALRLDPADSVAVLLRDAAAGEALRVRGGDALFVVTAREAIPLGHKIALRDIAAGDAVLKYGAVIGGARMQIAAGAHVHVHNVASRRARAA